MEEKESGNEGQKDKIITTSKNFPRENDEDGTVWTMKNIIKICLRL